MSDTKKQKKKQGGGKDNEPKDEEDEQWEFTKSMKINLKPFRVPTFNATAEAYGKWRNRFRAACLAHGCIAIIDGEREPPDEDSEDRGTYDYLNQMTYMMIIQTVDDEVLQDIENGNLDDEFDGRAAFQMLEAEYNNGTDEMLREVTKAYDNIYCKTPHDVKDYLIDMGRKYKQLLGTRKEVTVIQHMVNLVDRLPNQYLSFKKGMTVTKLEKEYENHSSLELRAELLDLISEIKAWTVTIIATSKRDGGTRILNADEDEPTDNENKPKFMGTCYFCGRRGHKEHECKDKKQEYPHDGNTIITA
eukprot:GFYU01000808.1.p1 GENE.GFYU01000808.1~~GFYU01000808.1.p1  ORF type:complete len:304 (+),score=79.89 GFYU01000808.1:323-1234(+)